MTSTDPLPTTITTNKNKRKCDEMTGEYWSLEGDDDVDPYSDCVLVVKTTIASTTCSAASTTASSSSSSTTNPVKETETKAYHVHRSKLGRASKYFDRLFRGEFREQQATDRVEITLDPSIEQFFETILQFLYCGGMHTMQFKVKDVDMEDEIDLKIVTPEKIGPLLKGADFLIIPSLNDWIVDLQYHLALESRIDGSVWLSRDPFRRQIDRCLLSTSQTSRLLEALIDRMMKQKSIPIFFVQRMVAFFVRLPIDIITKVLFDKLVKLLSGVGILYEERDLVRDAAHMVLLLNERFYPTPPSGVNDGIKLTTLELDMLSVFYRSGRGFNFERSVKYLSGLRYDIVTAIALGLQHGFGRLDSFEVDAITREKKDKPKKRSW